MCATRSRGRNAGLVPTAGCRAMPTGNGSWCWKTSIREGRMRSLFLGTILHFLRDPGAEPDSAAWELFEDGALLVEDGYVVRVGDAAILLRDLAAGTEIVDHRGKLII